MLIIRIKDTTRLSRRLPCPPFGKQGSRAPAGSFPPEVCGDFAPLRRFPLAQGHFRIGICLQPAFGPFNHLIELLCARSPRQSGAAFLLLDPQQGVAAVGINGEWRTHLLEQGQGMNNGQELTDIVGAINRAVMKHHLPRLEINATIFHLTRISRTGRINGQGIGCHFWWQMQERSGNWIGNRRRIGSRGWCRSGV